MSRGRSKSTRRLFRAEILRSRSGSRRPLPLVKWTRVGLSGYAPVAVVVAGPDAPDRLERRRKEPARSGSSMLQGRSLSVRSLTIEDRAFAAQDGVAPCDRERSDSQCPCADLSRLSRTFPVAHSSVTPYDAGASGGRRWRNRRVPNRFGRPADFCEPGAVVDGRGPRFTHRNVMVHLTQERRQPQTQPRSAGD